MLLATFVLVMVSDSTEGYVSQLFGLSAKNETLQFLGIGMGGVLLALQALEQMTMLCSPSTSGALRLTRRTDSLPFVLSVARKGEVEAWMSDQVPA